MKRISDEKIKKMKMGTILIFSLLLLLSVIICFLPDIFPESKYDELNKKDIVVSKLTVSYGRGENIYRIYTLDGESYNLTGDFERDSIRDILVQNTKATIKWSRNRFLLFSDYAEEVRVGDNIVVSYNNDDPIPRSSYFLLSGIIVLIDVAFLLLHFWWIKHLQTLQDKRDKRIKKKYGKLK